MNFVRQIQQLVAPKPAQLSNFQKRKLLHEFTTFYGLYICSGIYVTPSVSLILVKQCGQLWLTRRWNNFTIVHCSEMSMFVLRDVLHNIPVTLRLRFRPNRVRSQ